MDGLFFLPSKTDMKIISCCFWIFCWGCLCLFSVSKILRHVTISIIHVLVIGFSTVVLYYGILFFLNERELNVVNDLVQSTIIRETAIHTLDQLRRGLRHES